MSCTTILQSTGRGNSTGITIPKASQSAICQNHWAGALSWNPRGGGTELEFIPYTHPILKAEVRLKDLSIPRGGGTEQEFIPYTHLILKGNLRLKDLSISRGGGTEQEFIPYTHPILNAEVRLKDLSIPRGGGTEPESVWRGH